MCQGDYVELIRSNSDFLNIVEKMDFDEKKDDGVVKNESLPRFSSTVRNRYPTHEATNDDIKYRAEVKKCEI